MVFLEAVAQRFARRASLDKTCFVFPNRRSATFFKRYLGKAAGRPVFVPGVLTIDELFSRIAGIRETRQKARLLYILYQEYIKLMPGSPETGPEPFDQFIYWGDILLADFDDLDKYLVPVEKLLINLRDLKALSVDYDFLTEEQKRAIAAFCRGFEMPGQAGHDGGSQAGHDGGGVREKFTELWDILYPLYRAYREALAGQGLAYAGMIYRSVAESLQTDGLPTNGLPTRTPLLPQFDEIVFVGLNALNTCEKRLLDHLKQEGRADFYWDFAGLMAEDDDNPAGRFLRSNIKRYPPKQAFDCPARDPKQQSFEVISVPSAVGQTRKAGQILEGLQQHGNLNNPVETAVVLPDENLLFPMLGAVPTEISHVNVTMGYSLPASSGATLFQTLERLQNNRRNYRGTPSFYHNDVIEVLGHPYFAAAADPATIQAIRADILRENRIYVPESTLRAHGGLFAIVFHGVENTRDVPGYLQQFIEAVQAVQKPLEREFLYHFHEAVADLADSGLPLETLAPKTWYRLLAQYLALIKIPFEGEPLSGLQIMGPLETRALDFRNIIILSVGEGSFPSRSISASFLPYNLRLGFGLPTYEDQDAMWAYYFYRGICRAERIWLLYDSRTEGMQTGEESRFIKQLRYLYKERGVTLREKVATFALGSPTPDNSLCRIEKDDAILTELASLSYSATSLNAYRECPLRFYYEYVKGIKQQDEVVEEVDGNIFGDIFHGVMQDLYLPLRKRILTPDDLSEKKLFGPDGKILDDLVVKHFIKKRIHDMVGQNLILKELIIHFIKRVIFVDRELAAKGSFQVIDAEQKVRHTITLPDSGRSVHLYGKIDRLDSPLPGLVRVVDYKTGRVDGDKKDAIQFQLDFYSLLMSLNPESDSSIHYAPCIYAVRALFKETPKYSVTPVDKLDKFKTQLFKILEEIFDREKPFEPGPGTAGDPTESVCKYCNFKRLCNKE